MGEAKKRGTYEQRRAAAMTQREADERAAQLAREQREAEQRAREAALPPLERIARRESRHRANMTIAAVTGLLAGMEQQRLSLSIATATMGRKQHG